MKIAKLPEFIQEKVKEGDFIGAHKTMKSIAMGDYSDYQEEGGALKSDMVRGGLRIDVGIPLSSALQVDGSYTPANKVSTPHGDYIATQAPKANNKSDIWKLALQQGSNIIVDLTNRGGDLKTHPKQDTTPVTDYFPTYKGETLKLDNISITLLETQNKDGFVVSTFSVIDDQGHSREINHFHFLEWPDHGVPSGSAATHYSSFQEAVYLAEDNNSTGPTITHCRQGVGRTGVSIIEDLIRKDIEAGTIETREEAYERAFEYIQHFRSEEGRSFQFVQSDSQINHIIQFINTGLTV